MDYIFDEFDTNMKNLEETSIQQLKYLDELNLRSIKILEDLDKTAKTNISYKKRRNTNTPYHIHKSNKIQITPQIKNLIESSPKYNENDYRIYLTIPNKKLGNLVTGNTLVKIGQSKQKDGKREKSYGKSNIELLSINLTAQHKPDLNNMEKKILSSMSLLSSCGIEVVMGREYFTGNINQIVVEMLKIASEYIEKNIIELGINPKLKNITTFTTIDDNIYIDIDLDKL